MAVRRVAVTGASRGIGRATALRLARDGCWVVAVARSGEDLQSLADQAAGEGLQLVPLIGDVADDRSRDAVIRSILEITSGYGLDVVVNNAGYGQMGPVEEISPQQLRSQLEVNLVAVLAFTQAFLPAMRRRGHGRIVNISSNAAHVVAPFSAVYAASKAALDALSDGLRLEVYPFGIDVVLIEPGPIPTAFRKTSRETWPQTEQSPYRPYVDRLEGRKGTWYRFQSSPDEVADVISRAVSAEKPRLRYTVTLPAMLTVAAARFVPDRIMDWILRRSLGLARR